MIRWGHGHSLATGGLVAVVLMHGAYLWTLTAALLLGVVLGRSWGFLAGLIRRGLPVIEGRYRRLR